VVNQKHLGKLINKKNYKGLQNMAQNRKLLKSTQDKENTRQKS